jgi:hypothetical protein
MGKAVMNSLAITDALLCAVALWGAYRFGLQPALRLACGLLAIAAFLGVLRFSGAYPLPSLHSFFSMLGAMSALPLLAIAIVKPDSQVARTVRFAWVFFVASSAIGVLCVSLGGIRLVSDAAALIAVLCIIIFSLLKRTAWGVVIGLILLSGLLAMAFKWQVVGVLQSADFLHLGLAVGILLTMRFLLTRSNT